MKKILYTKFQNIEDIVANLMKSAQFRKAITRSNLCKFWGKVAGEKFSKSSKPHGMIYSTSTMVIACKTPVVAQELMLRKTQLLVKFKPYLDSLNMTVKDLKFDVKKWQEN